MASLGLAQQPPPPAPAPIPATKIAPSRVLIDAPSFDRTTFVSLSPDGKSLLTIDRANRTAAVIRDANTGVVVQPISNNNTPPTNLLFIDNETFAICWARAGGAPNERKAALDVTIHARKDGTVLRTLSLGTEMNEGVVAMAVSKDGKLLATRGRQCEVWNTATGERLFAVAPPADLKLPANALLGARATRFTDDGKHLLLGDGGKWRAIDLVDEKHASGPVRSVQAEVISFSPDGKFVSAGSSPTMAFYDTATGEPVDLKLPTTRPMITPDGQAVESPQEIPFSETTFSPDGKWWAGQKANAVHVYDITQSPPKLVHELRIDSNERRQFEWSRDSKILIAAGGTNAYPIAWDLATGRQTAAALAHDHVISSIAFSPAGDEMLTADQRGRLVRWSVPDLKPTSTRQEPTAEPGSLQAWYLSDGKTLLTIDMGTFTWLKRDTFDVLQSFSPTKKAAIDCFAFTLDGSAIVTRSGATNPKVQFFKPPAAESFASLNVEQAIRDMTYTDDGTRLLYTDRESIEVLNAADRETVASLKFAPPISAGSIAQLTSSPDSRWMLGVGTGSVAVWPLGKGDIQPAWVTRFLRPGFPSIGRNASLAFIPGSAGVLVIELRTGQSVAVLEVPDATARMALQVPNSSQLIVVSGRRRVVLYDLKSLITAATQPAGLQNAASRELWEMIDKDAGQAYAAVLELARRNELVPRVRDWLNSSKANLDRVKSLAALLAQLGDPDKPTREKAHRALERMGNSILPELQAAAPKATGETADRLASLIRLADTGEAPAAPRAKQENPERIVRLHEVLSWLGEKELCETLSLLKP